MNCLEAKLIVDDYIFGRLNPDDALLLEKHLATCPACRDALEKERRLLDLLRAGEVPDPGEEYWEGVEKSILARTIDKPAVSPVGEGLPPSKVGSLVFRYLVPLAASILLMVVSISSPRFGVQPPVPPDNSVFISAHDLPGIEAGLPYTFQSKSKLLSSIIMSPPGSITRHLMISRLGIQD